jgi:hypothetical protein
MKEIIHDFRPNALRWGWNGLNYNRIDDKYASMMGIGKGIKQGHYIAMTIGGVDYGFLVEEIEYDTNPNDLFNAKLKIAGLIED